ncbi:S9 family peptidase [Rhodoflexus caldus]|uniref:S9 family peptidase n=1 Tax=Rhodoflexus caldus TaxID=2891236 RepID=UPI00202A419F|nr:S9 family peptidase [Rhodoflexus caldus]
MQHHLRLIFLISITACLWACTNKEGSSENIKSVPTYTVEQFLNTRKIFGSAFSPNELKVMYSSNETGIFNAFEIDTEGIGQPKQLTFSKENAIYAISYFPEDERILFKSDRGGNEITNLFVKEKNGTLRNITPDSTAKSEFLAWAADRKSFFYISNRRDKKLFDLYEMDINGFNAQMIYQNEGEMTPVCVSDDKRYVALQKTISRRRTEMYVYDTQLRKTLPVNPLEGDVVQNPLNFKPRSYLLNFVTDKDAEFLYVKSYDLATGKTEEIARADWDVYKMYYSRTGKYRVEYINRDARVEIKVYETATNRPVNLPTLPEGEISSVNISDSEQLMAFYVNSSKSPNDLYVYNFSTGKYRKLTNALSREINPNDLVAGRVIRYRSYDSMEIPSILYTPHIATQTTAKLPAVLWIHGGPGGQSRLNYTPLIQYMVNRGYVVLAVNHRGSLGYGKTFFAADDRKHGDVDLKDCIAAKGYLHSLGYVDTARVAIAGGSYGGYMALAALAFSPQSFALGVDIFGVSNWLRTLNSIPPWWESARKELYNEIGDPKADSVMLYSKSPLFHAKNISRPLLVIQGANDPRVLKIESDQIVEAVRKNNVPLEYVLLPDEGHGFSKRENEQLVYEKIVQFMDKYLKNEPPVQ